MTTRMTIFATTAIAGLAGLLTGPIQAAEKSSPFTASEGEWLSLTGEVTEVAGEVFTLDYGRDTIPVEMDAAPWVEANPLRTGDEVTVTGRMDNDLYEMRKLEAASVYVEQLNEYFYADATDEEGGYYSYLLTRTPQDDGDEAWVSFSGEVESIAGEMMTLDAGVKHYTVDTSNLGYAPFDEGGRTHIEVGDRVVVSGEMDDSDLFEGRQIEASYITTLTGKVGAS